MERPPRCLLSIMWLAFASKVLVTDSSLQHDLHEPHPGLVQEFHEGETTRAAVRQPLNVHAVHLQLSRLDHKSPRP